jgi:hypothetical protein
VIIKIKTLVQFLYFSFFNGLSNFNLIRNNKNKLWELEPIPTKGEISLSGGTSASDSISHFQYLFICASAGKDSTLFAKFRSNYHYQQVLEHNNYWLGFKYLRLIEKKRYDAKI